MESTPRNFSTTPPLWNQWFSSPSSRRLPLAGSKANNCLRSAKRSGKSVNNTAATSPMRPCVFVTLAMVTNSAGFSSAPGDFSRFMALSRGASVFDDLQRVALLQLHAGCAQKRTDGFRGPSLFADHFATVGFRHMQLQHRDLAILDRGYFHFLRRVDQSLSNLLDQG